MPLVKAQNDFSSKHLLTKKRGVYWHKENNLLDEAHAIYGGGLPQVQDHLLGVEVLTEFLARKGELL
jgi:hypothetical protein